MKNIQNNIMLGDVRGVAYAKWNTSKYRDRPSCLNPKPSMFITRVDDSQFSVNLSNHPLTTTTTTTTTTI
jgi:hypothetical protein